MPEPYIGEIRVVPFDFAPRGWALCNGQLLPISQNTALFSIIGNTYGGDGKSTFALPNLQGRAPMHQGAGPGLTPRQLGQPGGTATVTLDSSHLPAHNHAPGCNVDGPTASSPEKAVWAAVDRTSMAPYSSDTDQLVPMNQQALATTGGNQPHNNMQPYLGLNFIIALYGVYPPRD